MFVLSRAVHELQMGCRQLIMQSDDVQLLLVVGMYLHGIDRPIILFLHSRLEHSHLRR